MGEFGICTAGPVLSILEFERLNLWCIGLFLVWKEYY